MNESIQSTQFEQFPCEIFHLIFDYLTGDDVLRIFFPLNQRFSQLISHLRLNTIDLSYWTRRDLIEFFKHSILSLTKSSLSLKLSNQFTQIHSCSANIELIFSSIIDFSQLKYLINLFEQLILIRPLIDGNICLIDYLLDRFLIYLNSNQIIFRKYFPIKSLTHLTFCSNDILRNILIDPCQLSNQILINYQNPLLNHFYLSVKHLKFFIDNYQQQWPIMSNFLNKNLDEFTLILLDNKFQLINGEYFRSILENLLSINCKLNIYLQFQPNQIYLQNDIDLFYQSYQIDFYRQHQTQVNLAFCRNYQFINYCPLIIYTEPFCSSKLFLINNQEILGNCSNYTNLTRLILDPCFPNHTNSFLLNNQLNQLINLTSIEFLHTPWYHFAQRTSSLNNLFREISQRLQHIHIHHVQCSFVLTKTIFPFYTFPNLRYLDITDNDHNCSILTNIIQEKKLCQTIYHLNIEGLCRLNSSHIRNLSRTFIQLQTLRFSMKFHSTFQEQLDTIGTYILVQMQTHLHYLHINFDQENLLIMSMIPSENQLSEWLGHHQKRFLHIQAIELNRNELSAWM